MIDAHQLWCAVVLLAWEDLFVNVIPPSTKNALREWEQDRREAHLFLMQKRGRWAQSRDDVCGACDIDPDALRQRALRKTAELKSAQA